jgi:hypothetical protein
VGVRVTGLDEWIRDLETLPKRAPEAFRPVMKRAGQNMKTDWRTRWEAIRHEPTHLPHLPRGIGYDTDDDGVTYGVEVGVNPANAQAFLAEIIEYGTLRTAGHPAGVAVLEAEVPRAQAAVEKAAADLLDGRR